MKLLKSIFFFMILLVPAVLFAQETFDYSAKADLTTSGVKKIANKVTDWQIKGDQNPKGDWTYGALYSGMAEWAKISGEMRYYEWLKGIGEKYSWNYWLPKKEGTRIYHADDYCIGHMYIELYRKYKDKNMIKPMRKYLDHIRKNPSSAALAFGVAGGSPQERWSWCDALFMAPPVWAKMGNVTGKKKYFDFMYSEYKLTTDYLFDTTENLYFRDSKYFTMKEKNGAKVFWGRGNGWVFAGLPLIIRELPDDYEHKVFFTTVFQKMAKKIISVQDSLGYWHASILDPDSYPQPEMSATGFFVFGLAWGINNGYLDQQTYLPSVIKGWNSMVNSVWPDGKLGFVQPIGAAPNAVTNEMTAVYGVGGFLLTAAEMTKLIEKGITKPEL